MTTATGDLVFDFKNIVPAGQPNYALPSELNAVNGPFDLVADAETGSVLRMSYSDDGIAGFVANNPKSTGVLAAHVEQASPSSIWNDSANPAILDTAGNGYAASGFGDTFYIYRVDGWVMQTSNSIASGPVSWVKGDVTSLSLNLATGELTAMAKGVAIISGVDQTYSENLAPGYLGVWSDSNKAGILSFGASGVLANAAPTRSGLRLPIKSRSGAALANSSGFRVVVRSEVGSDTALLDRDDVAVAGGLIEIEAEALGQVDSVVHVSIFKEGANHGADINAAGRAVVVDLTSEAQS